MRTKVSLLFAAVVGLATVGIAAPASAKAPDRVPSPLCAPDTEHAKEARGVAIHSVMAEMSHAGRSQAEIEHVLASKYGVITKASAAGGIQPDSYQSIITVYRPSIAYDSCARLWYISSSWAFNDFNALKYDAGGFCYAPQCDVPGDDVFAISLSRNIGTVSNYYMATWGRTSYYPTRYDRAWAADPGVDGVAFQGRDRFHPAPEPSDDYSFWGGRLTYVVSSIGCGSLQAFSKYVHTWAGAGITGVSIAPWSISISWGPTSNGWPKASDPSYPVYPC